MSTDKAGVYGEVVLGPVGSIPTLHADRMMGLRVGRVDGHLAGVEVQFVANGQPHALTIPILEAMAMLSFLKAFQLNEDLPFPEDPRDPNWRASDYKKKS